MLCLIYPTPVCYTIQPHLSAGTTRFRLRDSLGRGLRARKHSPFAMLGYPITLDLSVAYTDPEANVGYCPYELKPK